LTQEQYVVCAIAMGLRTEDRRGLQAPLGRLGVGLGLALDVKLVISRSAAERAVGFARVRRVCALRARYLLRRGPGPRLEGNRRAWLKDVRLMLVWRRCSGFVHAGDPFVLIVRARCLTRA
jgi:hypothetical protein